MCSLRRCRIRIGMIWPPGRTVLRRVALTAIPTAAVRTVARTIISMLVRLLLPRRALINPSTPRRMINPAIIARFAGIRLRRRCLVPLFHRLIF
jgi:hypothetical protein